MQHKRLVGVLPTRRLLTAPLEASLREIMVPRVVAVPATATVLDACEFFVLYKFLRVSRSGRATPRHRHHRRKSFCGGNFGSGRPARGATVLQAGARTDIAQLRTWAPNVFEALGFHLEQIRGASPWRVFRFRFPWLLVTVTGGTLCCDSSRLL